MVVDKLIEVVSPLVDNKMYRQGSLTENDKYPELFATFWENESGDGNHYDNKITASYDYNFDLNIYGSDVELVYETMEKAIFTLKENNFIVNGKGFDIASDEPNYIGRHIEVLYFEREEKENG